MGPALEVAVAVLRRGDGAVLLQRRAGPPFPGRWELPGGKVAPGEAPAAAAMREVAEELGVAATSARPLAVHEHAYPGGPRVRLHAFLVEAPAPRPRADLAWVPPGEAAAWDVLEATRPILAAAAAAASWPRDAAQP